MKIRLAVLALLLASATPAVAKDHDYFCYFESGSGATYDLSSICEGKTESINVSRSLPSTPRAAASNQNQQGGVSLVDRPKMTQSESKMWLLSGRVKNNTNQTIHSVKIFYEFTEYFTTATQVRVVRVAPSFLKPGEVGSFSELSNVDGKVKVTAIEWDWENGGTGASYPKR
jgi:hypothetical protein